MTILTEKGREQLRKERIALRSEERIEAEQELEKYRKWESIIHEHLLLADEYENASEYDKKDIMERIKELKEKEKEIKKELNIK